MGNRPVCSSLLAAALLLFPSWSSAQQSSPVPANGAQHLAFQATLLTGLDSDTDRVGKTVKARTDQDVWLNARLFLPRHTVLTGRLTETMPLLAFSNGQHRFKRISRVGIVLDWAVTGKNQGIPLQASIVALGKTREKPKKVGAPVSPPMNRTARLVKVEFSEQQQIEKNSDYPYNRSSYIDVPWAASSGPPPNWNTPSYPPDLPRPHIERYAVTQMPSSGSTLVESRDESVRLASGTKITLEVTIPN